MPVVSCNGLHTQPRLVQDVHDFFRYWYNTVKIHITAKKILQLTQRSFLQVDHVLFDVVQAARPNQDRIAELPLQLTVVRDPSESNFSKSQIVLLSDSGNLGQGVEVGLVPVTPAVVPALTFLRVETGAGFSSVVERSVTTCEKASSN